MKKGKKGKKGLVGLIVAVAVVGGAFGVKSCDLIETGKTGIVYNYKDGVQKETLQPGIHFISPLKKVKEFSTSNEILVMSKDKREGSENDDSFKVANRMMQVLQSVFRCLIDTIQTQ